MDSITSFFGVARETTITTRWGFRLSESTMEHIWQILHLSVKMGLDVIGHHLMTQSAGVNNLTDTRQLVSQIIGEVMGNLRANRSRSSSSDDDVPDSRWAQIDTGISDMIASPLQGYLGRVTVSDGGVYKIQLTPDQQLNTELNGALKGLVSNYLEKDALERLPLKKSLEVEEQEEKEEAEEPKVQVKPRVRRNTRGSKQKK